MAYLCSEFFSTPINNARIIFLILWLSSAFFVDKMKLHTVLQRKKYIYFYLFLFVYFIFTMIGSNLTYSFSQSLFVIRVFVPVLIYDILKSEDSKTCNSIVFIIMGIIIFNTYTINKWIDFYGFAHGLKEDIIRIGNEEYVDTLFAFVYLLPVLICALVLYLKYSIKEKKNLLQSGIILVIIIYLQALILKSLFMTAIVLSLFGIVGAVFYKKGEKMIGWFLKSIGMAIVLVGLFLTSFDLILTYTNANTDDTFVQRVEELKQVAIGDISQTQDVSSRNDLMMVSLNSFLNHPLFGVHYQKVGKVDETIVGNHSQWIDELARYGLWAILLFVFLYKSLKEQYLNTRMILPIAIYITIGFFNPILYPIVHITVFVLVPLLLSNIKLSKEFPIAINK